MSFTFHSGTILMAIIMSVIMGYRAFTFHSGTILINEPWFVGKDVAALHSTLVRF